MEVWSILQIEFPIWGAPPFDDAQGRLFAVFEGGFKKLEPSTKELERLGRPTGLVSRCANISC